MQNKKNNSNMSDKEYREFLKLDKIFDKAYKNAMETVRREKLGLQKPSLIFR